MENYPQIIPFTPSYLEHWFGITPVVEFAPSRMKEKAVCYKENKRLFAALAAV